MESSTPAPPPPSQPPGRPPSGSGFFESLMDTRFDHLITPSLIRLLYIIAMIIIGLVTIVVIIGGFAKGGGTGIVLLILAPIIGLLYLIATRVWLELVIVAFKIRDATEQTAVNTRKP